MILALTTTLLVSAIVVGYDMYSTRREFFPLEDPRSKYIIGQMGRLYTVKYYAPNNNSHVPSVEVLIGDSKINLKDYVGNEVELKGEWRTQPANKQCIAGRCRLITNGGRSQAVVVDIETIRSSIQ